MEDESAVLRGSELSPDVCASRVVMRNHLLNISATIALQGDRFETYRCIDAEDLVDQG